MHRPDEGVFEKGSHVLEYWLANIEGFTLARAPLKRRVTGVVVDPATGQAHSLIVRRSRRRTQVVAADAITAVDVHGRVLYAGRQRRRRAPREHRQHGRVWIAATQRRAAAVGAQLQPAATTAAQVTGAAARQGVSFASLAVAAGARRASRWTRAAVAAAGVRLGPLAAAYAHNAATIARAYARAVRDGLLAARSRTLER